MQLKRYTNTELKNILINIFYDYMSVEDKDSEFITPAHKIHQEWADRLKNYQNRYAQFTELLSSNDLSNQAKESIEGELGYLKRGIVFLTEANMDNQKKWYNETKSTNFTRSVIQIPLNKKINSYYDDFVLEVVFYDDVCTLNSKYDIYKSLETNEDRREFIKDYTEITNMGLCWLPNNQLKAIIEVEGSLNYEDELVKTSYVTLLPKEFSDFSSLTLKDTNEIENNDLKQFMQTKIDMDREDLELLSQQNIRGDEYWVYRDNSTNNLYIRYICRSTGRVYYNDLNIENLKLSEYFEENDYESYAKAWWNLTHLGSKVDGKPVIRC